MSKPLLGVALGSGSARGWAHIGILHALAERGFVPDVIAGAAVGALVGAKIGRDMDDRDRACLGQALELGATGQRITWTNASTGVRYELLPGDGRRDGGPVCRDFRLVTVAGQDRVVRDGRACQVGPGVWDSSRG